MKKLFISFLVSIMFLSTVSAQAGTSLKEIVDDLNYSLTVEWDQKDPLFYENQVLKFESELKAGGFSQADILNHLQLDELALASQLLQSQTISEPEALAMVIQSISLSYQQGASWDAVDTAVKITTFAILAGLAIGISVKIISKQKD